MTAHDLYEIVVGEIGRSQHEFLYEMCAWQLRLCIRGYYRRNRDMWSAIRWATYNLMCVSMADLKKAGIYKPTDLIKFPWDTDNSIDLPNQDEIEELRRSIQEENERLQQNKNKNEQ